MTPLDRFNRKTHRLDNGCIEWTGADSGDGYGRFYVSRAIGRVGAHRWAYEHHVGPIPKGMQLDHLCRNTLCVNPAHLEPVTCRENVLRSGGLAAKNALKTECPQGHPYTRDNLYAEGRKRRCRTCRCEQARRHYAARKAS